MNTSHVDIEKLREIPILDIATLLDLEVRGKNARCFNTLAHSNGDRKPSLGLDTRTNLFKCFTCGVHGDGIELYSQVRGVDFKTAITELSETYGIGTSLHTPPVTERGKQINGKLSRHRDISAPGVFEVYEYMRSQWQELPGEIQEYLNKRAIKDETITERNLFFIGDYKQMSDGLRTTFDREKLQQAGVANKEGNLIFYKHRLIIPFYEAGRIVYLQGRTTEDAEQKYLNLTGVDKPIYNLDLLSSLPEGAKVYICEGAFDAMVLIQEGYNAFGLLGVQDFTDEDVEAFMPFDVVLTLDNDEAGKEATQRIAEAFYKKGKLVKIKQLPEGVKDVTDCYV